MDGVRTHGNNMVQRDEYSFSALKDQTTVSEDQQQAQRQDADPPTNPRFLPNFTNFTKSFSRPARTEPRKGILLEWAGSWTWETAGGVLSIACAILLIAFLKYVDGTPYADWQYRISPNASISLIITVAKAATFASVSSCLSQLKWNQFQTPRPLYQMQVLDMASRGPWGSFEVLWTITPGLATVGALLMISSVAVDPLAQQVLSFPERMVPALNETAYAQAAHEYWPRWTEGSNPDRPSMLFLSPKMQMAILNGLGYPNYPSEPVCTTANCEYPDFISMGVCSRCENVTAKANQDCEPAENLYQNKKMVDYRDTPVNCTMTSPSGLQLRSDVDVYGFVNPDSDDPIMSYSFVPWTSVATAYNEDRPMLGIQSPIASFFTARNSGYVYYTHENNTTPPPRPNMTECAVYLCEQRYTRKDYSIKDRLLQVTETQPLYANHSTQIVSKDYYEHSLVNLFPPNNTETLSTNSSYGVDYLTYTNLKSVLNNVFNSSYSSQSLDHPEIQTTSLLWSIIDIGVAVESMATSMTNEIRANPKTDHIPGVAFQSETYIHVRWPWIILPLIDVFATIALFISTAIISRSSRAVLWKSSPLPLLAAQLQTTPEHDLGVLRNVDEMERTSKQVTVSVEEREGPLQMIERT